MEIINLFTRAIKLTNKNGEVVDLPSYGKSVLQVVVDELGPSDVGDFAGESIKYSLPSDFPPPVNGTFYIVNPITFICGNRSDLLVPIFDESGVATKLLTSKQVTN